MYENPLQSKNNKNFRLTIMTHKLVNTKTLIIGSADPPMKMVVKRTMNSVDVNTTRLDSSDFSSICKAKANATAPRIPVIEYFPNTVIESHIPLTAKPHDYLIFHRNLYSTAFVDQQGKRKNVRSTTHK